MESRSERGRRRRRRGGAPNPLPSSSSTPSDPQKEKAFAGTCPHMCPAKERIQRERLRDLSIFERLDGNPGRTTSDLAVKKFCRTISTTTVQTSELRPITVLQETLRHLFSLLNSSDAPFDVLHDFVFDRTRSIRQDVTMQRINDDQAINIYEKIVKFHIISHQKLLSCYNKNAVSSLVHLNMEQLLKVLMSLYDLYSIRQKSNELYKEEAEFYSFYVLLHLSRGNRFMEDSLSLWFRKLPLVILRSKEMCFARGLLRYFHFGNYVGIFRALSTGGSYFQLCLIESAVNEIRANAVSCINSTGYKLHPLPLVHLSRLLMLKESDLESLCAICGIKTSTDESSVKILPTKQANFCLPKEGFQHYAFYGSERLQRWQDIINGYRNLFDEHTFD